MICGEQTRECTKAHSGLGVLGVGSRAFHPLCTKHNLPPRLQQLVRGPRPHTTVGTRMQGSQRQAQLCMDESRMQNEPVTMACN